MAHASETARVGGGGGGGGGGGKRGAVGIGNGLPPLQRPGTPRPGRRRAAHRPVRAHDGGQLPGARDQRPGGLRAVRPPPAAAPRLAAGRGLGPGAASWCEQLRFGERGARVPARARTFGEAFLDYLARVPVHRRRRRDARGDRRVRGEPLLRVTAPRIEAQLLETLLLNQINFQTMIATKAARIVLAAGGGEPGAGEVVDFSPAPRPRHRRGDEGGPLGGDRRAAAARRTSRRRMRYGLPPVGTMAHSYVLSFADEQDAFAAFMRDAARQRGHARRHLRHARGRAQRDRRRARRPASRCKACGSTPATCSRSRAPRARCSTRPACRDRGSSPAATSTRGASPSSWRAGAPIDVWGVGTDLGTSRDSPVVGGVYKLVADRRRRRAGGGVPSARRTRRRCPARSRSSGLRDGRDDGGDVFATADEQLDGEPLLRPAMRDGEDLGAETLEQIRERANASPSLPEQPAAARAAGAAPTRSRSAARATIGATRRAPKNGEQAGPLLVQQAPPTRGGGSGGLPHHVEDTAARAGLRVCRPVDDRGRRASTIAPAHIAQGSRVT